MKMAMGAQPTWRVRTSQDIAASKPTQGPEVGGQNMAALRAVPQAKDAWSYRLPEHQDEWLE